MTSKTKTSETAREFVEREAEYSERGAWLLEHGEQFEIKPRPKGVGRRGKYLRCYENAFRIATSDFKRFYLVHGVAVGYPYRAALPNSGMTCAGETRPTHHAWVYDREDGLSFDATMEWHAATDYFGVIIPQDVLCKLMYEDDITYNFTHQCAGFQRIWAECMGVTA